MLGKFICLHDVSGKIVAFAFALLCSGVCLGHGFGDQLNLQIPLWLWLSGAALTVILSFAVVIDFLPSKLATTEYPLIDVSDSLFVSILTHPTTLWLLRIFFTTMLIFSIVTGIFGVQSAERNLAPTMVWVIFWVGLTFLVILFGNFWRVVNPFATIYYFLFRHTTKGNINERPISSWSAVLLLAIFMYVEHLWPLSSAPAALSYLLLAYVIFTLAAMKRFGPANWLSHGEVFSVVFNVFGRFSPIKLVTRQQGRLGVFLRPPSVGLLDDRPTSLALTIFILSLLAGVTFDGLIELPQWKNGLFELTLHLGESVNVSSSIQIINFLVMLLLPATFFIFLWIACLATSHLLKSPNGPKSWDLIRHYVTTLIPIAVAYHIAHYLTLLLIDGQLIIPLASDPFGWGWNLFGTADFKSNTKILSANFIWYFVVAAIVIGHMLSVYLAHLVTLTLSHSKAVAVKAGTPILLLMVFYTVISLWVIAQPALPT
jgi:hypothetical protein